MHSQSSSAFCYWCGAHVGSPGITRYLDAPIYGATPTCILASSRIRCLTYHACMCSWCHSQTQCTHSCICATPTCDGWQHQASQVSVSDIGTPLHSLLSCGDSTRTLLVLHVCPSRERSPGILWHTRRVLFAETASFERKHSCNRKQYDKYSCYN